MIRSRILLVEQGGQMVSFLTKYPVWVNFGGHCIEDVVILLAHLEYFMAIWYIFLPFGIFLWPFSTFVVLRYIWQPFGTYVEHE
jgi:hypothetical protein